MKPVFTCILALLSAVVLTFSSCKKEKDGGRGPSISFKTGGAYVSGDASVGTNTTVQMGITAAKYAAEDRLTNIRIYRTYDGDSVSEIYSETLSGASADNYSKDIRITTRDTAGTEEYSFIVSDWYGLNNGVVLTLTVQ